MLLRYVLRVMLFVLPIAAIPIAVIGLAVYSGEAMPVAMVADLQLSSAEVVLYQPADSDYLIAYKLRLIERRRPQVMVLGSSRANNFQCALATHNPDTFFRVASPEWRLVENLYVLDHLTADTMPDLIVMAIDWQWFLGTDRSVTGQKLFAEDLSLDGIVQKTRALTRALLHGEADVTRLFTRRSTDGEMPALGVAALMSGQGYWVDGSQYDFDGLAHDESGLSLRPENYLRNAARRILLDAPSAEAVQRLADGLARAQQMGATVITFQPPFRSEVLEAFATDLRFAQSEPTKAAIRTALLPLGIPFYDLSATATFGSSDAEMRNPNHDWPLAAARIWLWLGRLHPEEFAPYTDLDLLESWIDAATDPYHVFPDPIPCR